MKTVRESLRALTPEEATSLFGHKTKKQVAQWLGHGQIPFKAADKLFQNMFFTELAGAGSGTAAERDVNQVEAGIASDPTPPVIQDPPPPQFTAEQLRVMELEEQLERAKQALANDTTQKPAKLTWADVERAGANKPVVAGAAVEPTKEIAPGVLEINPAEQSTQSMTLPGRVLAAVNLPPKTGGTTMGPRKIEPGQAQQQPLRQVGAAPVATAPVSPQKQAGWVGNPNAAPTRVPGWTEPAPKPAKADGSK